MGGGKVTMETPVEYNAGKKEDKRITFEAGYKNRAARRGNHLGGRGRKNIVIKGQGNMGW